MDMTAKRAELLASVQFPATVKADAAAVRFEQLAVLEPSDKAPFFGGYMMDDMLEDMGVSPAEEDSASLTIEDIL